MADSQTVQAYALHAEEFAAHYDSLKPAFLTRLLDTRDTPGRLLDIGCGSGRDLAAFSEEGWDVLGIEPVGAFRESAVQNYPILKGKILKGALPDDIPDCLESFDIIHCSAVLMHLEIDELFNSIFTVRNLLSPDGVAHFSFCPTRPGIDSRNRSSEGRLFNPVNPDQLKAVLTRAGFSIVSEERSGDGMRREGIQWVSLIARKEEGNSNQPLQRIEQIVNNDTKDATYKLALLRALSELASSHFHEARWIPNGLVAVPVTLVVDKWIQYYWPVFESGSFIAQKNGEEEGCRKPVMFRKSLTEVIKRYSDCGSYTAFLDAGESDRALIWPMRRKVREAIRSGPVKFASGGHFSWRRLNGQSYILLPQQFWKEMAELSHWIEPAIRLRWAEETCRFSKQQFQVGEILNLLSKNQQADRNVSATRRIFSLSGPVHCTWTNNILGKTFDVDHIIPYRLWHNNDLWNLVPADPKINHQKRDKLVSRGVLYRQRDRIIHSWERQRAELTQRFDREIGNLIGRPTDPDNWQSPAFNRLAEVIEATALRRQAERWSA